MQGVGRTLSLPAWSLPASLRLLALDVEAEFSLLAGTQPSPSEAGLDPISLSEASSSLPSSLEVPLRQCRFWKTKAKKELMPASRSSGVKREQRLGSFSELGGKSQKKTQADI